MFKKYSIELDLAYSIISIIVIFIFFLIIFEKNLLIFDTKEISGNLINLFGVLFGFFLTVITILFMFDTSKNSIFRRLQNDKLIGQIFKRFFDSLIVTFLAVIYFLILSIYFENNNFILFKISLSYSQIFNFLMIIFLILTFIRTYRCLNLMNLIYKSIMYDT